MKWLITYTFSNLKDVLPFDESNTMKAIKCYWTCILALLMKKAKRPNLSSTEIQFETKSWCPVDLCLQEIAHSLVQKVIIYFYCLISYVYRVYCCMSCRNFQLFVVFWLFLRTTTVLRSRGELNLRIEWDLGTIINKHDQRLLLLCVDHQRWVLRRNIFLRRLSITSLVIPCKCLCVWTFQFAHPKIRSDIFYRYW